MDFETHFIFNELLINIRNMLWDYNRVDSMDVLCKALKPCFNVEDDKLNAYMWYFTRSCDKKDRLTIIDLFKDYVITGEKIVGFLNNLQDEIYNQKYISDKEKDILADKIQKLFFVVHK